MKLLISVLVLLAFDGCAQVSHKDNRKYWEPPATNYDRHFDIAFVEHDGNITITKTDLKKLVGEIKYFRVQCKRKDIYIKRLRGTS